jgi:hypothetical protein
MCLLWREFSSSVVRVVAQFDLAAVRCAGDPLVPLVKTRDFGMTPRAVIVEDFKIEPLRLSAVVDGKHIP